MDIRNQVREVLEKLVHNRDIAKKEAGKEWDMAQCNWFINDTLTSIHALYTEHFRECLPAKEDCKEGEQYWMWQSLHNVFEYGVKLGKNSALAEIKAKLEEEK